MVLTLVIGQLPWHGPVPGSVYYCAQWAVLSSRQQLQYMTLQAALQAISVGLGGCCAAADAALHNFKPALPADPRPQATGGTLPLAVVIWLASV